MTFHCPTCGDVIDVPDSKLPYSGNCPFCAAPVRLDAAKAIDRETEPPPEPVRPPPPPPARRTAPPPARPPSKIGGAVGTIVVIVVLIVVRIALKDSKRSTPKVQVPQFQMPKFDHKLYACYICNDTGKTKCRACEVICPRCGNMRSVRNSSCPACQKWFCSTCRGSGQTECVFCKSRRREGSKSSETPRSP